MPRAPRILIEGGLYHVYNRFESVPGTELRSSDRLGEGGGLCLGRRGCL
jgi:hypothetical protein